MKTNPVGNKRIGERKYTIRGHVGTQPISITTKGVNLLQVLEEVKKQHPGIEVTAVYLLKE